MCQLLVQLSRLPGARLVGTHPDPLVLSLLRIFAGLHVLTMGVTGLAFLGHDEPHHSRLATWFLCLAFSALLTSTWVPAMTRSPRYVSLVLFGLCCVPLLGQALAMLRGAAAYQKMATELVLVLVVPLVLVAWQRSFRVVVLLALATGAVDIGLALLAPMVPVQRDLFVHLLVSRTFGFLVMGYLVSRLAGKQRREHGMLTQAHARLKSHALSLERLATSRERNRVARELHDTLAHTLSAIAVQLEAIRSFEFGQEKETMTMVDRTCELARSGLNEVRRALRELRATPLQDLGLGLALRGLAEALSERTGIELDLQLPAQPVHLPETTEQGLFRIVQEALENVERHSGARHVRLALHGADERLCLTISDDGQGFDPSRVGEEHYGLRGIRERAELLGGSLTLTSDLRQGTTLALEIPLDLGDEKSSNSASQEPS